MDREKQLQGKYAFLLAELNELKNKDEPMNQVADSNGQQVDNDDNDM